MGADRATVENNKRQEFGTRQRRRAGKTRAGGPQKTEEKTAHDPFAHHPGMHDSGIKLVHSRKVEGPQRHPGDSDQHGQWKKKPERLLACHGKKGTAWRGMQNRAREGAHHGLLSVEQARFFLRERAPFKRLHFRVRRSNKPDQQNAASYHAVAGQR